MEPVDDGFVPERILLLVTVILRNLLETKNEKYVLGCTTICKKEKTVLQLKSLHKVSPQ